MYGQQHTTLLRLQQLIRERLTAAFPLPCWVTAEISEIKVNYSGHCYLELVEKGGDNAVPKARASAVIWRSVYGALSSYFRSETGGDLAVGMSVMVKVAVSYHELYGLSLTISDIDPLYTLGDMQRQRQMTIERLQREGVFDMNRSLEMPWPVQRVAVISSRNAAGYQDFMRELASSGYRFELTLFDAFMQGHAAEDSIVDALETVLEQADSFDAVVVIRGGGSQSDLSAFDSYRLAGHLAQFPLPVITGIGHDKDESVADLVAAVSLKTPTAVAVWLADGMREFEAWLDTAAARVGAMYAEIMERERERLNGHTLRLSSGFSGLARSLEARLTRLEAGIMEKQAVELRRHGDRLDRARQTIGERARELLKSENARLEAAERIAAARNPDNILALGFAVVRRDGSAIRNAKELASGDRITVSLWRGTADALVENVKTEDNGKE